MKNISLRREHSGITVIPVKTISFKVTEDEARRIRQFARRERLSLSAYLRSRAAGNPAGGETGKVRCKFTGAEIFAAPAGAAPLTTEAVREMLSDFP
jgi:hypothetical protein